MATATLTSKVRKGTARGAAARGAATRDATGTGTGRSRAYRTIQTDVPAGVRLGERHRGVRQAAACIAIARDVFARGKKTPFMVDGYDPNNPKQPKRQAFSPSITASCADTLEAVSRLFPAAPPAAQQLAKTTTAPLWMGWITLHRAMALIGELPAVAATPLRGELDILDLIRALLHGEYSDSYAPADAEQLERELAELLEAIG